MSGRRPAISDHGIAVPSHESRVTSHAFPIPEIRDSRVTIHEMRAWGEELGRRLRAPAVIALQGELGTGKRRWHKRYVVGLEYAKM